MSETIIQPGTLTLRQIFLTVAASQLGLQEIPKGSNWGPHVQKYLAAVKINFPASWCMGFVQWCVKESFSQLGRTDNPLPVTGGVLACWNKVPKQLKVLGPPEPGDIFILDYGKGLGHTGFVSKLENGRIYTIEGNSNDEGSREGFEVCRKPGGRPLSACKGFIRLQ